MLGAVERLEGRIPDVASQERGVVDGKTFQRVARRGVRPLFMIGAIGNIPVAEVIDVEEDDFSLLGEDAFNPLKFFSLERYLVTVLL
jgi:hypothetical protein